MLTVQLILHQEHGMGALDHVPMDIGDGAEAAALHKQRLVVEKVGGLNDLSVATEENCLGQPLGDKLQTHDPVIHHGEIGAGETDHVDLDPRGIQIIEK